MAVGTSLFLRKFPYSDEIVILDDKENRGKCTDELSKWAESVQRQTGASPVAPEPAVQLPDVSANASGVLGGTFTAGLYGVYVYREVTVADPVSQSLGVTLTFTHNGKPLSRILPVFSGAPMTTSDNAGSVETLEIDPNTTIGYQLTYASNTPLLGRFHVTLLPNLLQTLS